ncbi:kti12, chromatin associated [Elasticomyces elasticus]|uniref:Kti12, chromatin associated n=1 Tax=Exophiala sideris TaxID=1016849 RepID=A0ABR0JSI6_9EURO|nr:kti12, chromatin associated [Elasticomyces elasticus]KAK5040234.1 kti12, chromatin associated [Exophiala sideris]KAK5043340.1 kti12, chromatin associated [Exophiala sideris]KAK5068612.1 kti12, chromatin associated [Exophiala sideris]KAK5186210.1 kti12, chromatin associated [Eurotiomycetes sp. CCFEE 6388]
MPLIIITGLPCSGKTHRAQQIAADLKAYISADPASSKRTIQIINSHHASTDLPTDPNKSTISESLRDQIYNSAAQEKNARAAEFSAIKRAVSKDNIVIADGLNYIKGYRYQLWCEAKAAGTRCCVVHVAAQEDECNKWNRERLRAWGREEPEPDTAKQNGTGKGENVLGELMPESHTAIYGDRVDREHDVSRSRSPSIDAFDDEDRPRRQDNDAMTLKSLYITDRNPEADSEPERPTIEPTAQEPSKTPASPSTTIPVPSPTSSPPYTPATLHSLVMRYEPPSPFSRWDTPLFTIPSFDTSPPSHDIWTALFPPPAKPTSKKALSQISSSNSTDQATNKLEEVKRHAATVLPKATTSDALQILESATMDVIKHILARSREDGIDVDTGGDLSLSLPLAGPESEHYDTSIHIPAGLSLSQPVLQRLRRKYTQIQRGGIAHGQGYVSGRRGVIQGFIEFLDREWNDDDDWNSRDT